MLANENDMQGHVCGIVGLHRHRFLVETYVEAKKILMSSHRAKELLEDNSACVREMRGCTDQDNTVWDKPFEVVHIVWQEESVQWSRGHSRIREVALSIYW